ncbi:MAG TPA: MlaD family protein [Solirubrobacteraceae bacterium]
MLPVNQLLPKIAVVAAFALSCFLLLVFLWSAFGGPIPLRAQGYQVTADFDGANTMGVQAEVRISGVPVGRVVALKASPDGLTRATIQLDARYAPLPRDTHAILRAKSLLGETYVELSPGAPGLPPIPDHGHLPQSNISPTVQLNDITRTFDARTRAAFGVWQIEQALAVTGRGRDINDSIALLDPLEEQATALTKVLNRDPPAISRLVRNTGVVFSALSARGGQLRSLIRNANTVFSTTGKLNTQLAATFTALPTFEQESALTLDRIVQTTKTAGPLVNQLKPVAQQLAPTAQAAAKLAPDLSALVSALGPLQTAGATGLPATDVVLGGLRSFATALPPSLDQINPILGYVGTYSTDLTSFIANVAAATQAAVILGNGKTPTHYLRTLVGLTPEQMASYPSRLASNRTDPYAPPGTTISQTQVRPSINTTQCTGKLWPLVVDGPGVSPTVTQFLRTNVFGDRTPIGPPCVQRGPRGGTLFPQLKAGNPPVIP